MLSGPTGEFFCCQRQRGGVNDNPTVQQFCSNTQAIGIVGTVCKDIKETVAALKG